MVEVLVKKLSKKTKMRNYKTIVFLLFTALIVGTTGQQTSSGQETSSGPCPEKYTPMENFELERYVGTWYLHGKTSGLPQYTDKCHRYKHTLKEDGSLNIETIYLNRTTFDFEDFNSTATLVSPGHLWINYTVSNVETMFPNYIVLETDYDMYSLVYSCNPTSDEDSHTDMVWVLTRVRDALASNEVSGTVIHVADKYFHSSAIRLTEQINLCEEINDE